MQKKSTLSFPSRAANYLGLCGPGEFIVAGAFFVILVVLSVLNVFRGRIDSDEPYHIYIAWSWTRGFVQYRDVFDNHMPLAHLLFAPITALIGERPAIIIWMRLFLLPMYFVTAWCTYLIGARLFSRRIGVWAVLLLGFFSGYHSLATQFRTDNLWTPLFVLCVLTIVSGQFNVRRFAIAGYVLGLCFGVSLKSIVFLVSLALSFLIAILLVGGERFNRSPRQWVAYAAVFIGSAAIVPATIISFFALKGLWPEFRYQVFEFNLLARLVPAGHRVLVIVVPTLVLAALIWSTRWIVARAPTTHLAFARTFVFLLCAIYLFLIEAFWPLSKTYLPAYPLGAVMLSAGLCSLGERFASDARFAAAIWLPATATIILAAVLLVSEPVWKNKTLGETTLLRDVLALTTRGDYVLDCKGETIFRRRSFRPLLERITRKAIKRGIIADDAPQRCIETRTCVVSTRYNRYSPATRAFIERAYLPVTDQLSVAGTILKPSDENRRRFQFEVVIPASYQIISRLDCVVGVLDAAPYDGSRFLDAGPHVLETTASADELLLLWSNAVDRHYLPRQFEGKIDK